MVQFLSMFLNMDPDRMKYQNNSISYMLCMLAVLVNVFGLMSIMGYPPKLEPSLLTGVDIFAHIIFMMMTFMAAEKTKVYSKPWAFVTLGLAGFQCLRTVLFVVPYYKQGFMTAFTLTRNILYLVVCALFLAVAGIICYVRSTVLQKYWADKGEIVGH